MAAQPASSLQFEQLLPAFCQGRIVIRVLVLAQALAILLALAPTLDQDFWARLGLMSLFVHWVALLTVALLCRFKKPLLHLAPRQLSSVALLLLLLVTWLVSTAAFVVLSHHGWQSRADYFAFLLQTMLIALLVGGMGIQLFALYIEHSWRLQAQSRSELDALQARIRPHFLFNSLNTVAELTQQDATAAETALLDLASLFRAALNAGAVAELAEELALAKRYLALEQWRLGDRLQLAWQLPSELPAAQLPCLTLQPLLENAVHHGIEPSPQGGLIRIELTVSATWVAIVISNPLPSEPRRGGNGMALENIKRRLELQFGDAATLTTHTRAHSATEPAQFRVKLVIPLAAKPGNKP